MNPLQEYAKKRDFKKTREPAPEKKVKSKSKNPLFVVQEHHASHLHYDFRLELNGVLKSWAVPKGPSLTPGEKRLAVEVEDHPLSYAKFTGSIPEGEYGAGEVYRWDMGFWEPPENPEEALKKGRLEFTLKGKKLQGRWLLIRTKRASGKKNQWLLIKRSEPGSTVKKAKAFKKIQKPEFIAPQLALLVDQPPEGTSWIHETKFDGYRIQAHLGGAHLKMLTRSGQDWTSKYPLVAKALKEIKTKNTLLDGEIVVLDPQGRSDFQLLQNAMKNKESKNLIFYVFDLLILNGKDLRDRPLSERKEKLNELLGDIKSKHVQYVDGIEGSGKLLLKTACKNNLEGIISKTKYSPYISGRVETWLKSKCKKRQEFIIGGYTDPQGSRSGFGALLLGVLEGDQLRYVGKVGTGFTVDSIKNLMPQLKKHLQKKSPFALKSPHAPGIHWLEPELVAEIEFANWTEDKILRVPVFQGLREDKPAAQIHIEKPQSILLTHPDKVIYAKEALTKNDLAQYYQKISEFMLPHLQERPLSILRCPSGTSQGCFFQKNYKEGNSDSIHCIRVKEKTKTACYIAVDSEDSLRGLVQMGSIEIHPWNSRQTDLEKPDQMVLDFDPGPGVAWQKVIDASFELKSLLDDLKLKSFVKLTGGKGIHVHVPLEPMQTWEQVRGFAKFLADQMEKQHPSHYVTEMSKKLRPKKIFIDYLRNSHGATAVAPYSLRAKETSAVAMPLTWQELKKMPSSAAFTLDLALKKIAQRKTDPWAEYFDIRQNISKIKF
jgi:bifunctional non-homologous end joining protein LigD